MFFKYKIICYFFQQASTLGSGCTQGWWRCSPLSCIWTRWAATLCSTMFLPSRRTGTCAPTPRCISCSCTTFGARPCTRYFGGDRLPSLVWTLLTNYFFTTSGSRLCIRYFIIPWPIIIMRYKTTEQNKNYISNHILILKSSFPACTANFFDRIACHLYHKHFRVGDSV